MSKKAYSAADKFSQPIESIKLISSVTGGGPLTIDSATRILLEIIAESERLAQDNEDEFPVAYATGYLNDTPVEADARRRYRSRNPSMEDIDMIIEAEFGQSSL
jgi:hypothetical protein